MGWAYALGPPRRGVLLAILHLRDCIVEELSIFIDESGDFGKYDEHSPYYIVTLVFHEQKYSINERVKKLNLSLDDCELGQHTIHSGPLIRKEKNYSRVNLKERYKIFNKLFYFARTINIKYKNIIVDKKVVNSQLDMSNLISKELSSFIKENLSYFQKFNNIIIYYDNGQMQLANILVAVFSSWFQDNFEYRSDFHTSYKLFQTADLICTLSLIEHKLKSNKNFTLSETNFFGSPSKFKKNYLKHLKKKEF